MEVKPIFKSFFFISWLWIIINLLVNEYTPVDSGVIYAANGVLSALSLILICTLFREWSIYSFIIGLSFLIISIDNILLEASVVDETLYALDIGIGFFLLSILWCFISHTTKPSTNTEDHILFWLLLLSVSLFSVSVVMHSSAWIYVAIMLLFLLVCVYLLTHIPDQINDQVQRQKRLKWIVASLLLFTLILLRIIDMYEVISKKTMYWVVLGVLIGVWIIDMVQDRVYNNNNNIQI